MQKFVSFYRKFLIMNHDAFIVKPGSRISLKKDYDTAFTADFDDKNNAKVKLQKDIERLAKYQDVLYAQNTHALVNLNSCRDCSESFLFLLSRS